MGRIPEDTIQLVRDRVDIVDLVGRSVGLKKAGRSYKGLCPFHSEKTPSFVVSPDRGTWHCFGCGEGGNAFAFLMRHEGLTFPEAVRSLAAELGIPVPESEAPGQRGGAEPLFRANALAQDLYRASLEGEAGAAARRYLAGRGISSEDAARFGIGFAPDGWDVLVGALRRAGIPAEVGERAGLLRARERGGHYDGLRGRVSFAIRDPRGRIVGFGGRALAADQEPKYLNTPESPVFRKREAFFGFPDALEPIRRNDRAVVVEGYFDQLALVRAGIGEALATCGTALTEEHARQLLRRTRNVVLLFDGDEAGERAMLRALEVLLPHGLRVRAAALPPGLDPHDYLTSHGAEALAKLVDEAPPALARAIERAVASGIATPWERADAVGAVLPLLSALGDPVERSEWARRLALAVGVEPEAVDAALRKRAGGSEAPAEVERVAPRTLGRCDRLYGDALAVLLAHPALAEALPPEALASAGPDAIWRELGELLVRAARAGSLRVDALLDQLEGEARQRLSALAAGETPVPTDLELARRALQDTLVWLSRRRALDEAKALNRRIAQAGAGASDLLLEKQRQLERRRETNPPAPGTPR